jgi:hypothetical protein
VHFSASATNDVGFEVFVAFDILSLDHQLEQRDEFDPRELVIE